MTDFSQTAVTEDDLNPFYGDASKDQTQKSHSDKSIGLGEHEDPDKHWIGESLGAASVEEITAIRSQDRAVGNSVFPARADHEHGQLWVGSLYTGTEKVCPPGTTFFNNLTYSLGSTGNLLASGNQVIVLGKGIWKFDVYGYIYRQGGGAFAAGADFALGAYFNNGGGNNWLVYDRLPGHRETGFYFNYSMIFHYGDTFNVANNLQFALSHGDGANLVYNLVTVDVTSYGRRFDYA